MRFALMKINKSLKRRWQRQLHLGLAYQPNQLSLSLSTCLCMFSIDSSWQINVCSRALPTIFSFSCSLIQPTWGGPHCPFFFCLLAVDALRTQPGTTRVQLVQQERQQQQHNEVRRASVGAHNARVAQTVHQL